MHWPASIHNTSNMKDFSGMVAVQICKICLTFSRHKPLWLWSMKEHFWEKWFCRQREEKPVCGWYLLLSVNVQEHPWARNIMRCCNYSWMPVSCHYFLSSPPCSVLTWKAITLYNINHFFLWYFLSRCKYIDNSMHNSFTAMYFHQWHP